MDTINTEAAVEVIPDSQDTPTATKRPYNRRPVTPAPRDIKEIEKLAVSKLTENEKSDYIKYLKDLNQKLSNQNKNLDETCKKVFERSRIAETEYEKLHNSINKDMNIIRTTVAVLAETIIKHTYTNLENNN